MKRIRVECNNCIKFIPPAFKNESNLFSKIIVKAKCKLGKRVIFRKAKSPYDDDYGYIRYCNDFK